MQTVVSNSGSYYRRPGVSGTGRTCLCNITATNTASPVACSRSNPRKKTTNGWHSSDELYILLKLSKAESPMHNWQKKVPSAAKWP